MNSSQYHILAVDIGKYRLDVRSESHHFETPNGSVGFDQILKLNDSAKELLVVCEATGGYERELIAYMHAHDVAVVCINPALLRAFAKSEGVKAKSDVIDSKMILQFAKQKQLRVLEKPMQKRQKVASLMDRRHQLNKMLSSEKNRIDKTDSTSMPSLERLIGCIEKEIETIESQIQQLISSEPVFNDLYRIFIQIKGVGPCTAWSTLAYLGELGQIKRTKLAALVGLAPYLKESGTFKGKRKIEGGRSKIRNALYMAAHTACTHNPVISAYAKRLEQRGKPKKWIKVAAMRKLLMHMHFLTKNYYQSLAA